MGDWRWSDLHRPRGPWGIFALSGECLTTLLLWGYTAVLLWPGSTLTQTPAFAWLVALSAGREWPWAAAAFCLAWVAPLAVYWDDGRIRCLSLLGQGTFFIFLGLSGFCNFRLSLGWWTFVACGLWLLARAVNYAIPHLHDGKAAFDDIWRVSRERWG